MAQSSPFRSSRAGPLPPRHDPEPPDTCGHPASDPLAELARLIGQDETLRELTRNSTRHDAQPAPAARPAEEPHTPPWLARPAPSAAQWRDEKALSNDPYAPAPDRAGDHAHHADHWDAPAGHE